MPHNGAAAAPGEPALLDQLKELVRRVVDEQDQELLDIDQITSATPLLSLPLDSLATIELLHGIEETFKIDVPEEAAFEFQTIGEIVHHIRSQLDAKQLGTAAQPS